ncbi:hypothetical protein Scep_001514 [Stephania cephalantha]|uniref:Protein kinase domain-containing protein n=1 Tax=Stephania cephalantha TaxID=152367 RepID=A0AAP0L9H5_9MAGN
MLRPRHYNERSHQTYLYNVFLEFTPKGDLLDLIEQKPLGETDVQRYTRSILRGLRYIHKKGYVHCDIKPHNIFIFPTQDDKTDVKIADFGAAMRVGSKRMDLLGTTIYISPEALALKEQNPFCDIWALGCVVVQMCRQKDCSKRWTVEMWLNHPFVADQEMSTYESLRSLAADRSISESPK